MIDNFDLIKPLFYFNESNYMFFHCQIVRRAKDHKPNKVKEKTLKTYIIRSKEQLEELKEEIVLLCEHFGARAYINVSGKDFELVNKSMLSTLADSVLLNNVCAINPYKILTRTLGTTHSRNPRWVIDIDDISLKDSIIKWLDDTFTVNTKYLHATIPTVQGEHLIVEPFNVEAFNESFPQVDVHKNSMGTLLYFPDIK